MARRRFSRTRCYLRGSAAVVALLLSAADHLAAAALGIPPVGYMARRVLEPLADEFLSAVRPSRPGRPVVVRVTPAYTAPYARTKGI